MNTRCAARRCGCSAPRLARRRAVGADRGARARRGERGHGRLLRRSRQGRVDVAEPNLLLGADLMLSADRPLPPEFAQRSAHARTRRVPAIRFNSMVQPSEAKASDAVLADVKAVGAGYPLRGAITLVDPTMPEGPSRDGRPGARRSLDRPRLAARLGAREAARGSRSARIDADRRRDRAAGSRGRGRLAVRSVRGC